MADNENVGDAWWNDIPVEHTLTGMEGAEIYHIGVAAMDIELANFTDGEDKIDFSRNRPGITSFDQLDIQEAADGSGVIIDLADHGGGRLYLSGVSLEDFDASDFIFNQPQEESTGASESGNDPDAVDDTIVGGEGEDWIAGGAGDDTIYGGAGDDTLHGDEGDDTISGGAGDDTMTGGEGADTFVYSAGHGNDTITDFTDGEDTIDLSAITGITGFGDLSISADGGAAVIDLSAHQGGTITLENVDVADLDAEDFTFYEAPVDDGGTEGM